MKLRAYLVDDEPLALERLRRLLNGFRTLSGQRYASQRVKSTHLHD